jgi:hypothetical protein
MHDGRGGRTCLADGSMTLQLFLFAILAFIFKRGSATAGTLALQDAGAWPRRCLQCDFAVFLLVA